MWGYSQEEAAKQAKQQAEERRQAANVAQGLRPDGVAQIDPESKIREIVERTGGDYAKLTDDEKNQLEQFTHGHGRQYFDIRAAQRTQKVSPASKK